MPEDSPIKNKVNAKLIGTISALIANTFIWYFYAFNILRDILSDPQLSYEVFAAWSINFGAAALSAILGATLTKKLEKRSPLIIFWITLGIFSSFLPIFLDTTNNIVTLALSLLFGISLGLGLPSCMGYFSESINTENRAKTGGIVTFIFGLGAFLLGVIPATSIVERSLILSIWRIFGLLAFLPTKNAKITDRRSEMISYAQIFAQRSFLLYFIPWCMFCLINYSIIPITTNFFGEDFVRFSAVIEGALVGIFAIVGGFLADIFGRKRLSILGFVALGVGYAILGLFSKNLFGWYFYITVDGMAWGIFSNLFLITLWGDLAYGNPSEKYYAIGGLPFLLSNFLRFIVGPFLVQAIPIYTVFSLASFFLFLAVFPLTYAPETLPEKRIRERELRQYIEKAKKIREKSI
jgi:MFS family permease